MKSLQAFLILILLSFSGCFSAQKAQRSVATTSAPASQVAERQQEALNKFDQVSLKQADQSQSMVEAMNRKILRNADFQLEVSDPTVAQRQITSMAESLGGFVVTSESKQRDVGDRTKQQLDISLVLRIPALQFNSAVEQIRATASRVIDDKITGQDVTEEFIDLEARIKTQKALELQFLEIMKQANKVADALEVQRQIAEVRSEIEKLEGRKRFLENRASLSTITVGLQTPTAIAVNTSGFGREIKEAVSDSFRTVGEIVLFLVRFVIVMIPILILVILPGGLLARYIFRRAQRWNPTPELESTPGSD
ncbi:MAG: DUF4349 domain-containing protein [Pyrinomonadaceae bacterium]|nr:DUF4349 domain-containing protein [Pyrinomonadaceae bacterium]